MRHEARLLRLPTQFIIVSGATYGKFFLGLDVTDQLYDRCLGQTSCLPNADVVAASFPANAVTDAAIGSSLTVR